MDLNPSNLQGTVHEFTFDLETQGIRTRSYTKKHYEGRPLDEPIGISSIAYGRAGKKAHVNAFTDIITPELLHRHAITQEILDQGLLPNSLLDEVARDNSSQYDPTKPPRWDPSVRNRGSIVDQVFRRHAKQVLKGDGVLAQKDVYQQLVNEWSGIATAGGKVSLGAWNVGYDMPTLFREMRRHGFGTELDSLLKSNTIRVREMAESLHSMRFQSMLNSNWTPVMTDRSVLMAAVDRGLTSISPEQARNLGAVVEHTGLRQFMDDVKGGREAFKSRASKWLTAQRAGNAQAQAVAEDVINRLSGVHDWATFQEFVAYGHKNAHSVVYGEQTLQDVIGEMYGGPMGHAHIFGDTRTLNSTMRYAPMQGQFSAFSFIGGSKLGDVSGALVKHADELGVASSTATEISNLLGEAHTAEADRTLMERTSVELDRIRRDKTLFDRWAKIDAAQSRAASERRIGELYDDLIRGDTVQRSAGSELGAVLQGGGKQMKTAYGKVGKGGGMGLQVGFALAAMYMIGRHNELEKPPEIQGFRHPRGEHDTIEGINMSDLPFSNISAFGSGHDPFYGMLTASHLGNQWENPWRKRRRQKDRSAAEGTYLHAKVERELEASGFGVSEKTVYAFGGSGTIDFMLGGQIPLEIKTASKLPSSVKPQHMGQIQYDLAATQQPYGYVMYVERGDDSKRRIFRVEADAQRLSWEMANLSSQIQQDHAIEGSKIVPYLKQQMSQMLGQTMQDLRNLYETRERVRDPFMWTALGSVSSMTDEEEPEDDPFAREQPVGYGGLMANRFRSTGHAGYVQNLSEDAMGHAVRDHATQLHRLPGMPRTLRGRRSYGMVSHAERSAMMGV